MKRFVSCALLAAGCLAWSPAAAELVVFVDGGFLKVEDYRVRGKRMHLELAGGGTMKVAMSRIARVVDDEVIPVPPAPEAAEPAARTWRFEEGDPVPPTPYGAEIFETAKRHELSPTLVAAVVRAESAYDPQAVSRAGARGLMQLMPATGRRYGLQPHQLFEPARNLEAGTRYLSWLLDRFDGDLDLALAGYNAGEGTVDRYGGVPPYRETQNYIKRIYRFLGI